MAAAHTSNRGTVERASPVPNDLQPRCVVPALPQSTVRGFELARDSVSEVPNG